MTLTTYVSSVSSFVGNVQLAIARPLLPGSMRDRARILALSGGTVQSIVVVSILAKIVTL